MGSYGLDSPVPCAENPKLGIIVDLNEHQINYVSIMNGD